jgi:hypothetical protein
VGLLSLENSQMTKQQKEAKDLPGTPTDFVYAGRRQGTKGMVHVFHWVDAGRSIGDKFVVDGKVFGRYGKAIGGVYTGARYDGTTAYGLTTARFCDTLEDKALIIQWEALDAEYAMEAAAKASEGKIKPVIQQELLGIRRMMAAMRKRGAHHEVHALIQLVQQELYRPLTKDEAE